MLRGIDISDAQHSMNVGSVAADFVLIKATGGIGYVNPTCDTHVQQAKALGRKWGVYHYFNDGFADNDPIREADWFVDNCLGYIGQGILVLDWERGGNPDVTNVADAKRWLDRVFARTGVRPLVYMSASLVTELDWSAVVRGNYGLWAAAWPNGNNPVANYNMNPNNDPNPHWDGNVNDVIWQFTSTGRLDGYGGNLDCDFFYGTREAWDAYARPVSTNPSPQPTTTQAPPPPTTTTTTTAAPAPEPPTETTTTTVAAPPSGNGGETPPPTETTTTTSAGDNGTGTPPVSTTTTTSSPDSPIHQSLFGQIVGFVSWLISLIFGKTKKG